MKLKQSVLYWISACFVSMLLLVSAAAAGTVYVSGTGSDAADGSAASPYATLAAAAEALGGSGRIVLAGDTTLAADAELGAGGAITLTAVGDARLILLGNLYLGGELRFENITLDFRKSGAKIFCRGHAFTVGGGVVNRFAGTAPSIFGGSFAGRAGETAKTLSFGEISISVASGTWSALTGGSYRNGEGQPVGTLSGVHVAVTGGSFVGTDADADGDAVLSLTGFDALEGDGRLILSGGSFACGIFGVGRPGYNATVTNNQHTEGSITITVTGGSFTGGRIAAVQDAAASEICGDFTLTVLGGSFAASYGGFDGTGTRGIALADVAKTYLDRGIALSGFDDLIYLSATGTGDGRTAATPAASARPRGGKVVLLGVVEAAALDLSAQEKPITVTGGAYGGTLRLSGILRAKAPLTLCDLTLSGEGTLSGGGHDLTLGEGIIGGENIALIGGGTSSSADYTVRVRSGTYKTVTGGPSAADATVSVCIEGGKVLGEVVCARNGNASILVSGGEISGNLYAFSSHGGTGGIAVFGGKVHGTAAAAKSPRDGTAVRRFGCFGVPCGRTDGAAARYLEKAAVFVCDGGTGDGQSPLSPLGDLAAAVAAAGGGEVVLCGPLTVPDVLDLPATGADTRITAVFRGVNFAKTCGAELRLSGGIRAAEETRIYDLPISVRSNAAYISAEGHPLTLGEGITCTLAPNRRVEKYPTLTGGSYIRTKTLRASPSLTVKSGTWGIVSGGSYHPTPSLASAYSVVGDITLAVRGGRIVTRLLAAGGGSLTGNAHVTVSGGILDCAVFGMAAGVRVNGNVTVELAGGEVRGAVDRALGDGSAHNGVYTLLLSGGDLSRLGATGARAVTGKATAALCIAPGVDTAAEIQGETTYQNPVAGYADPSVIYVDGWYYYAFAKDYAGKPALWIARAANLCDIAAAEPTPVWVQAQSDDAKEVLNLWAPQLYEFDGVWYMYTTCETGKTSSAGARRVPLIWKSATASPMGPYTYAGGIKELDEDVESYLSPRILRHGGKIYMVCGGFFRMEDRVGQHIQRLFIGELADPMTLRGKMQVISSPMYDYENGIMEGPFPITAPDGSLYLAFAAGHTRTDEYCTGLMRFTGSQTDALTDATLWKKYDTPLQFTDPANGVYSPGAMVFVPAPDGSTLAVYHAKQYHYSAYTMRRMYMQTLNFDKDGKPSLTAPPRVGTVLTLPKNPMPLDARITGFDTRTVCADAVVRRTMPDAPLMSNLLCGDTDADGVITLRDVLRTLACLAGRAPADLDPLVCDPDHDGKLTLADALLILHEVLGQ